MESNHQRLILVLCWVEKVVSPNLKTHTHHLQKPIASEHGQTQDQTQSLEAAVASLAENTVGLWVTHQHKQKRGPKLRLWEENLFMSVLILWWSSL